MQFPEALRDECPDALRDAIWPPTMHAAAVLGSALLAGEADGEDSDAQDSVDDLLNQGVIKARMGR